MSFYNVSKIKLLDPSEREIMRLFWRDDMENYATLKWPVVFVADSVGAYVNDIPAFEGDYVLELTNAVVGAQNSQVAAYFGALSEAKHSVEFRWYKTADMLAIYCLLRRGSPTRQELHQAYLFYSVTNSRWEIWDSNAARIAVPGGDEIIGDATWNYVKLIIDWRNRMYSRLITNSLNINLETLNLSLPTRSQTGWAQGRFTVALGGTANPLPVYYDDVRIYLDEE